MGSPGIICSQVCGDKGYVWGAWLSIDWETGGMRGVEGDHIAVVDAVIY